MNQAIGQKIKEIFEKVEQHAVPANKSFRVSAYWHIGRLMVGEERKAQLEEAVVPELVEELSGMLASVTQGKHLKKRLWMMRAFYLAYPEWEKVEVELSWAHYQLLSKIETQNKKIEDRLLNAFNRIRETYKNGLAVVTIERNSCGGCFAKIPPQRQLEIRQRKRIIQCEHCGRVLVDLESELI